MEASTAKTTLLILLLVILISKGVFDNKCSDKYGPQSNFDISVWQCIKPDISFKVMGAP